MRDETAEERALRVLKEAGYVSYKLADFDRLRRTDVFQDELIVMADVRAYFQVAYKV